MTSRLSSDFSSLSSQFSLKVNSYSLSYLFIKIFKLMKCLKISWKACRLLVMRGKLRFYFFLAFVYISNNKFSLASHMSSKCQAQLQATRCIPIVLDDLSQQTLNANSSFGHLPLCPIQSRDQVLLSENFLQKSVIGFLNVGKRNGNSKMSQTFGGITD